MEFKYKPQREFKETIDIKDIGQCALELTDNFGCCSYLVIRTTTGSTTIFEYGPIMPDVDVLPKEVSCKISTIEYSQDKIESTIDYFIADKKTRRVMQVVELTVDEALDRCVDLIEYMRQFNW